MYLVALASCAVCMPISGAIYLFLAVLGLVNFVRVGGVEGRQPGVPQFSASLLHLASDSSVTPSVFSLLFCHTNFTGLHYLMNCSLVVILLHFFPST